MKAFGNNVLVQRTKAPTESPGGITLPSSVGEEYKLRGHIISIGEAVESTDLQDGKEIIFSKAAQFKDMGVEYVVVNVEDILVVLS